MDFFHVDRQKQLKIGTLCNLDDVYSNMRILLPNTLYSKDDVIHTIENLFPDGLSKHGRQYLLEQDLIISDQIGNPMPLAPHMPMIELIFELVRRSEFPDQMSRFQSMFGCESIEDARKFKEKFCGNQGQICLVECKEYSRLDMSLLLLGKTSIGSVFYARKYWSGEAGNTPEWEILMKPPIEVIRIIE